jgi:transcriptional regulator with XRE-family HTH domain
MDARPYPQIVAEAVKQAMTAANHTEASLSEASGIPRVTLRRRLLGVTPFTVAELAAIAAALGVSVEDLAAPRRVS